MLGHRSPCLARALRLGPPLGSLGQDRWACELGAACKAFVAFLQPQSWRKRKLVPSWGWMCTVLVAVAPISAQVMGPVGSRISPRGDHAPPGFVKSLDGVKGEMLSASTTLSSLQRICTVGWLLWGPAHPQLCLLLGALAAGETTPPCPILPE